jgi:hypothetical protein
MTMAEQVPCIGGGGDHAKFWLKIKWKSSLQSMFTVVHIIILINYNVGFVSVLQEYLCVAGMIILQ